jgi:hypothetical protein
MSSSGELKECGRKLGMLRSFGRSAAAWTHARVVLAVNIKTNLYPFN